MKLSLEYLIERHDFWKDRIGMAGIWNSGLFKPVSFAIRKDCKSYNGMFQRKIRIKCFKRIITDKIIIYNKVEDFDVKFLDTILVHEMIHQYIIQNNIKDTSTHGRVFKDFMNRINRSFKDELEIKVRDRNPSVPKKGEGNIVHTLLLIQHTDGKSFCAVMNPKKTEYFEKMLKKNKKLWNIQSYSWAESKDVYFNQFRRCTRALHGVKKARADMQLFCNEYNIKLKDEK